MIITSISNSNFIHYAKTLHPFHPNYRQYWLQEYSRIIEGYWNSGVFMPPKLYFYVNHGTIQKKKGNLRIDDHPDLRDVEWDFHYTLMEAKGFSGFSDDPFFSSHKSLIDDTLTEHPSIYREEEIEEEVEEWNEDLNLYITNTVKKTVQVKKQYVDPRTYLRSIHKYHLGKPLYFNECENLIFMAGRGLGKDLEENTLVYKVDINSIDASNSLNGFKYTAVKIKDIEIGDFILSYNLTTIVKVINKESYSNQVMYKISLKNDNIIECGGGHLWYTRSLSRIKLSNTEELYNHYHYYKNSYNISLPIFNAYNTDVLPDSIKKTIINSIFNKTIFTRNKFNTFSITEKTSEPNTINFLVSLFNKWGIKYRYSNLTNRLWCNLNRLIDINKEKDKWVLIKDIEKTIIKNSVCIEVEDLYNTTIETRTKSIPNKLFAIGKNDGEFIITHNSFLTEHVVLHEWLTDGVTDTSNPDNKRAKVEIVVGASDAKYSIDHLSKLKNSLEKLRGGYKIGDRLFPAPLNKRYTGGWNVSNKIIAQTKIRKNGIDRIKGTKSFIKHVSWNGNPFAAQGGRNNLIVYEEIGMANELLDVYGAIKDTMIVEGFKMGVAMFIGCVCKGTKVWTQDGREVNVEDLKQEDGILGYNGEGVIPQSINWFKPPEEKECYRITLADHSMLECSYDHPLLVKQFRDKRVTNFVSAEDLKEGMYVTKAASIPVFGNEVQEHAYMTGLMIGDGYYSPKSSFSVSCNEPAIEEYIKSMYSYKVKKEFTQTNGNVYKELSITDKNLKPYFRSISIEGQCKDNKRLPNTDKWSKDSICELLAGYFDADGNVKPPVKNKNGRVVLSSVVIELLEEVKKLLFKLGIQSNLVIENRNTLPYKGYEGQKSYIGRLYIVKCEEIRKFKDLIPIKSPHKIKALDSCCKHKNNRAYGYVNNHSFEYREDFKKGDYFKGKEINNLTCSKVVKVEPIGKQLVYNLNTSPTHTYITNGMISHNTGGAFSSGGTLGAYKMFYNPKAYQCLAFGDEWENKGSIGYFIPAYYSYNDLRDDNGNIIMDKAVARLEKKRKENTDSLQLANDMQNNPQVPSEIFLVQTGNLFPSAEIKARINAVEANQDILQKKVELYFDKACVKTNGVNYTLDTTNKLMAINDYPWKDSESQITREGSVVIYEFPIVEEGRVPEDLYIIGHDPFKNNTDGGESFAGIYVLKTTSRLELGTNEVVAEYIGRPFMGEDAVNDILLKLSMFYGNAKIFFENNVGNTKEYFEKHRMLHLLATKPGSVLTNSISKGPNVIYGYNISNREIKMRALGYVRQWLLDKDEVGNRNLDKIQSRILLKQLLQFNLEGNFDAVMAFAGCIIGLNERYNKFEERVKELTVDSNDLEFLNTFLSYRDTNSIYLRNRIL